MVEGTVPHGAPLFAFEHDLHRKTGSHFSGSCSGRQADFLFFLSSSTSVNSASTTSSFLAAPSPGAAPPGLPPPAAPPPAPSCACLYIASPSFIEACASVLVLAVIAAA